MPHATLTLPPPPPCARRIYILAQLLAAVLACSIFAFTSGWGHLSPITSTRELGLTYMEAGRMFFTGSPPKRFRQTGKETITDVVEAIEAAEGAPMYTKAVLDVANNMKDRFGKALKIGGRANSGAAHDQAAATSV